MNNDNDNNLPELSDHLKESLSALLDGELNTTEAAFLIKRMAHDGELNAQWQRFQGIGELLRGQAQLLKSDDFSARVLSKIALNEANSAAVTVAPAFPEQKAAAINTRFNRQTVKRFGTGIAIAAAVAWAALLLPQQYPAELAPPLAAQTAAPLTLASPVVSMRTVSGHIGATVMSSSDQNNALLAQSMDAFLLEHVQRSPISPISDAVYLQTVAGQYKTGDSAEMSQAPQ